MTQVLPPVPPPEAVLTTWERAWFWFATNRKAIGGVILTASVIVRGALAFKGHSEVADTLKAIADLFIATGAATAAAGATHGDEHFEIEKSKTIRSRSGQFRAFDPNGDPRSGG